MSLATIDEIEIETKTGASVDLQDLFRERRLNTEVMSGLDWLVFVVYLPFGCMLSLTRFLVAFTMIMFAPVKWRQSLMRGSSGMIVRTTSKLELPTEGVFLLGNHSSYFDCWIYSAACSPKREFATVVWHGVPQLIQWLARPVIQVFGEGRNREFLQQLRKQLKQRNVILFPEGAITDTKSGLLKFEKSVFALKRPVYLVAARYHRPLAFVQPKALSANLFWETAVELFQPWTNVELRPIGELVRLEGESPESFADRAQKAVADELGLAATDWTRRDRHRLLFPRVSAD